MDGQFDQFLRGILTLGFAIAGLFFLRFWSKTKERLFGLFSMAFFVLAVNRSMIAFLPEVGAYLYLIRLAAFLIILYAIWDANRRP